MNYLRARVARTAVSIGTILLAACASAASQAGPEKLALRAGDDVHITGTKVQLSMVRMVEDSRCPAGAQCVWAGNAAIALRVHTTSGLATTYQLNTSTSPTSVTAMGYDIRLDSLFKDPKPPAPHLPNEYVAWVTVTPAKAP